MRQLLIPRLKVRVLHGPLSDSALQSAGKRPSILQVSAGDADKSRGTPMDPSTRERLGLRAPGGPQSRERAERAMAARSLMYIFAVRAVVAGLLVRVMRERIDALLRSLDSIMHRDMLTGLLDERGFEQILDKEFERARRSGNRVGVVVAEADGDGDIRHRLGERRAEEVLAVIGEKVGGTIRLADEAALIDSERFAVVCPYTD